MGSLMRQYTYTGPKSDSEIKKIIEDILRENVNVPYVSTMLVKDFVNQVPWSANPAVLAMQTQVQEKPLGYFFRFQ